MTPEKNKSLAKQRSINLTDHEHGLLTAETDRRGLSTISECLRQLLREWLDPNHPNYRGADARVAAVKDTVAASTKAATPSNARNIVVPDPRKETFTVPPQHREKGNRIQRAQDGLINEDIDF